MTHIPLDTQEEAVKQFLLSLTADPQGTVLELNGRPLVCVLPLSDYSGEENNGAAWTEEKNARRCLLIDWEIDSTLTPAEAVELNRLQRQMLAHRRQVAPLPLDDARKLHQELLAKAQRGTSGE